MAGASAALNWDVAESNNIDRFNNPAAPVWNTSYGFKGFPDNDMMKPKIPLTQRRSADVSTNVTRYFRKDSASEWKAPPPIQEYQETRMPTPPRQQVDWLQTKRESPPPQPQSTISPRYPEAPPRRKSPVIRDPLKELTSADIRRKREEHYLAEEDIAMAQRRKEEQKLAKLEEQQKIRELQDSYKPWGRPGGGAPNRRYDTDVKDDSSCYDLDHTELKYEDTNRGMDGVRSSMERRHDMVSKSEDLLRQQEQDIDRLRQKLALLEKERQYDTGSRMSRMEWRNEEKKNKLDDMIEEQGKQLRHLKDEFNRSFQDLKAHDDLNYQPARGPEMNGRAHSDDRYYPDFFEPQTERPWRPNRDREMWGHSDAFDPAGYLNVSPRRRPVGKFYNKISTYGTDFNSPAVRHGNQNLGNPNQEKLDVFSPFGLQGGGAPMVDQTGQRKTRIAGSMGILGRELSDSARARRSHNTDLLHTISQQAANDRARRQYEKEVMKQPFVELTDRMRQQKVGYPKYKANGEMDYNPLPHMFDSNPTRNVHEMKSLRDDLTKQVDEKYMRTELGDIERKTLERQHAITQNSTYGKFGGGNKKGYNLKKVNLDRAIHNPTSTSHYYNKVRLEDEISPPEILDRFKPRVTVNSTHRNLYEFPEGSLKGIDVRNYMGHVN